MFGKKKMGFKGKPRTLAEINQDYNHHAAQAGHKARVVKKILSEIDQHENRMESIDAEAKKIPPEPPKAPETEVTPTPPEAA